MPLFSGRSAFFLTLGTASALVGARLFFRPPERDPVPVGVLSQGVTTDGCGQFTGEGIEGQDSFVPLSAIMARPRRRARWVRRLEAYLGLDVGGVGRLLRGQWTPDLLERQGNHVAASILERFPYGAKIIGGGSVLTVVGEAPGEPQGYIILELPDGSWEAVFPELHNRLASYALFRKRDALLVPALRVRALDWCKSVGLSQSDTWIAVASAIHLVWQVSPRELYAAEALFQGRTSRFWWSSS